MSKRASTICGLQPRAYGFFMVSGGVLWLCPDALLLRLYESDGYTQLFWKNVFFVVFELLGFLCYFKLSRVLLLCKNTGLVFVTVQGLSYAFVMTTFTFSCINTAIANTLVLIATGPLWSALFSWAFLAERIRPSTLTAIALGFASIAFIFLGEALKAEQSSTTWLGNALGLACAIGTGANFTFLRYSLKQRPKSTEIPGLIVGGLIMIIFAIIVGGSSVLSFTNPILDPWLAVFQGGIVSTVAQSCLQTGPRYLLSSEVALLMLIETILSPLMVYAAGFEAPPQFTAIGGAALVLVLGAYFSYELKKEYEEKKTTPSGADFDNAQLTAVNAV